jgi:hypothetical protein
MKQTVLSVALAFLVLFISGFAQGEEAVPPQETSPPPAGSVSQEMAPSPAGSVSQELEQALGQRRRGIALTSVGIVTGTLGLSFGGVALAFNAMGGDFVFLPMFMGVNAVIFLTSSVFFSVFGARLWVRGARQVRLLRSASRLPWLTVALAPSGSGVSLGVSGSY